MKFEEFKEEVYPAKSRKSFCKMCISDIADLATDVTDNQDIFEAGQNFLQYVEDAKEEFLAILRNNGIKLKIK